MKIEFSNRSPFIFPLDVKALVLSPDEILETISTRATRRAVRVVGKIPATA